MKDNVQETNHMTTSTNQEALDKKTYSVDEIAQILQISRSKAYSLCKSNEFKVLKLGRLVRVSKISFDEWFDRKL